MSKLIKFAREYALKHHGDQDHGCLKIGKHLEDVAKHVAQNYEGPLDHKDPVVAAAWLHDLLEDTNVDEARLEKDMFKAGFAPDDVYMIRNIVKRVTDGSGLNRKERHLNTYWRIREDRYALLIKLCDRRHNHERSIQNGEIYAAMYAKEWDYFRFALWYPGVYRKLWTELSKQNKILQQIVGW